MLRRFHVTVTLAQTSSSYIFSSFSGIIQSFQFLIDLTFISFSSCSFLCEKTGDSCPENIRASCCKTILSTSSLFISKFPCSFLIADKLHFFRSALLTKAQNCFEFIFTMACNLTLSNAESRNYSFPEHILNHKSFP